MDIRLQIKSLLSEAELYRAQGLFADAKQKYTAASEIINRIDNLKNKEGLIKTISEKIQSLEEKTEKAQTGPASPELSEKGQDLIKNLFGENDLQKAVALARFGQFERSIVELQALLKDKNYRMEAARNIIRCKMAMGTVDDAIDQYNQWFSSDLFSSGEMEAIRVYLQPILEKRGIEKTLPAPVVEDEEETTDSGGIEFTMPDEPEEEILEITSIGITFSSGSHEGKMVEIDVNFQSGELLSMIIPKTDKGMIEDLKNGDTLEDIQFYSPIAMFSGTAVVANKTQIDSGPKRGDFCLDLKITST